MCGRVVQSSGPLRLAIVEGLDVTDSRLGNVPRRYNAAPSQELMVIRQNHKTGERSVDLLKWGLIPNWCSDPRGGRKPINAKAESVARLPTFREGHAFRPCIVPVDGFFEWRAIRGARGKQPYAIAMKDGSPFGLAGLWENWRNPDTGEWERTFAVITGLRTNWLLRSTTECPLFSTQSLLIPYPAEPMTMWPISTRVNKPENDEPSILDRAESLDWQAPLDACRRHC